MSIHVRVSVSVGETPESDSTIVVESGDSWSKTVVIVVGDKRYVVVAEDLMRAIKAASQNHFP